MVLFNCGPVVDVLLGVTHPRDQWTPMGKPH